MSSLSVRIIVMMVAMFAVLGMAFKAGDKYRNNAWLASQAKVERQAKADYEADVKRGDAAVAVLVADARTLQNNFQNLTEKFNGLTKRVPLVVAGGGGACAAGTRYLEPLPGQKPIGGPETLDGSQPANGGSPVLSAGAVWMWDSALAGTDQPSGACGSLDTSEAACAVATTLDLDDAWANHRTNAQTCAEDRLAHQRLIDFVKTRDAQK